MVRAEHADGVDPMFRAPQLSRFKSDGLLCVERGWMEANEHRVAGRDTPKHQITEVTDSIDKEGVARACACFRTRIKKVIDGKGDHI